MLQGCLGLRWEKINNVGKVTYEFGASEKRFYRKVNKLRQLPNRAGGVYFFKLQWLGEFIIQTVIQISLVR